MDEIEQKRVILRAQLKILLELSDLTEEGEDFYSALIDLKSRILRNLRKLKVEENHVSQSKHECK